MDSEAEHGAAKRVNHVTNMATKVLSPNGIWNPVQSPARSYTTQPASNGLRYNAATGVVTLPNGRQYGADGGILRAGSSIGGTAPQDLGSAQRILMDRATASGNATINPAGQPPSLPQFDVTKTVKQPGIANATDSLLAQQQQQAAQTASAFQSFLNEARDVNAANKAQLAKDQAAFDTSRVEAQLPQVDARYQTNQNNITTDIEKRNADFATETADTLNRLRAENDRYAAAARGVADKAIANANVRTNLYQLTSGTPTSGSGALTNRYIRNVNDIEAPLQRELSLRNYDLIANTERGYDRELYGQDQALLGRRSSLEADFAARTTDTAKYLNNLRMQVAGMSRAQADSYLRSLGLPFDISQRIISGDIANLSGIQQLDDRANYYTVNTPFDDSRIPQVVTPTYAAPQRNYLSNPSSYTAPQVLPSTPSPAVAGAPMGATRFNPVTGRNEYVPNALTTARAGMIPVNNSQFNPDGTYRSYYNPK